MLDFVYYPVSAILWFWHTVFGGLLDPASGVAWALSVAFLVFTLRAVLYPPFVRQARSQRAMQRLQPQILALKKKHAGDREALASALQQLQRENGVNPVEQLPAGADPGAGVPRPVSCAELVQPHRLSLVDER